MSSLFSLVAIVFGVITAIVARARGRNAVGWFAAGFVLGPFGLIVALLPPLPHEGLLIQCPACCEVIRDGATVCRHCGSQLSVR